MCVRERERERVNIREILAQTYLMSNSAYVELSSYGLWPPRTLKSCNVM